MKVLARTIALLLVTTLPACSYIRSWFPDKSKEYQYAVELPPLVIPPDLGTQQLLKPPASIAPVVTQTALPEPIIKKPELESAPVMPVAPIPMENTALPVEAMPPAAESLADSTVTGINPSEPVAVELTGTTGASPRLRLTANFDKAWRLMDKALSRRSIEVSKRDRQKHSFTVHYAPTEQKLEDGSWWDEALFAFSGFNSDEKTYFIQLQNSSAESQQTEVIILNAEKQPATDANALELLKRLQDTIKTDFAR